MTVQLCSMFRDSTESLTRYISQVRALRNEIDVKLVLAEGDSIDGTYEALGSMLDTYDTLIKCDHGGPRFGSVNHPVRWQQISKVVRAIVEELDPELPTLWVEGDLIWDAPTMLELLRALKEVPAVAPMVLANGENRWYDTYGFRINGRMFEHFPPHYTPELKFGELVKIDSCGSCFALAPQAFGVLKDWGGIWPFPADGLLWLDPRVRVYHP